MFNQDKTRNLAFAFHLVLVVSVECFHAVQIAKRSFKIGWYNTLTGLLILENVVKHSGPFAFKATTQLVVVLCHTSRDSSQIQRRVFQ